MRWTTGFCDERVDNQNRAETKEMSSLDCRQTAKGLADIMNGEAKKNKRKRNKHKNIEPIELHAKTKKVVTKATQCLI